PAGARWLLGVSAKSASHNIWSACRNAGGPYIPSAFLRLLHSLQNCGHFWPAGTLPSALAVFHSAPQARMRDTMAARPPGGLAPGSAAGGGEAASGVGVGGAAAAGASPDMHCLLKSRYFMPAVWPAAFISCHWAAHSFMVLACAGADMRAGAKAAKRTPDAINNAAFMEAILLCKIDCVKRD